MIESTNELSRRRFLAASAGLAFTHFRPEQEQQEARQSTGLKIGEVTDNSAIVWMRLTQTSTRKRDGVMIKRHIQRDNHEPLTVPISELEGSCPGAPGLVRLQYSTSTNLSRTVTTPWVKVTAETDFTHQFALSGLRPATVYYFAAETAELNGKTKHGLLRGSFVTAPPAKSAAEISFCVLSCQMYAHLDHDDGFNIYPAMQRLAPNFVVFTGDNVYYDNEEPRAKSVELARYHWERMYSLPRHVELLRNVASYWEKDDHDTLDDDCWPATQSRRMAPLTFTEGQRVFRQQTPQGATREARLYRSFRWGKHLQIWLTEGRDFRSPNNLPDASGKTIWGAEQKAWLQRTLRESDATWKVLISPTPLVGPDRVAKNDNHSNRGFTHEGDEVRRWFKEYVPGNLFVICGDRHWQYHSVHPETGLREFSAGAASDEHAGGSPGEDPRYHRFHRVKGGFVSVTVTAAGGLRVRHHDVEGKMVHEWNEEGLRNKRK
jgi:alkaline phosphatase D